MNRIIIFLLLTALLLGAAAKPQRSVFRRPMYPAGCTDISTLGTLKLWLKADAITGLNDGDAISTWTGSANSNDATGSGSTRPIYKTNILNGKPAVRPDASDDKMSITTSAFLVGNDFTAFFVVKIATNKSNNNLTGGTNATSDSELRLGYSDTSNLLFGQYIHDLTANATSVSGGEILTFNRKTTGREIFQGTTSKGTDSDTNLMAAVTGFMLFHSDLTGSTFQGDVLEIAIFQPAISAGNVTSVQNSLGCKYGL